MKKNIKSKQCCFCGGNLSFSYILNGLPIVYCSDCHTSTIDKMPDNKDLEKFYDGFKFSISDNTSKLICNNNIKNWFAGFNLPTDAQMLDIGGGGGYFSYAFEQFGFGKATYIDIDPQACKYAKETLDISNVICDDVHNISSNKTNKKYDFIYCRHVIEHLTDPISMIHKAISLLSDQGYFVLQFPNGLSFERLHEIKQLKLRIHSIKEPNNWSYLKTLSVLFSRRTAFDLWPVRHLWAISKKGMSIALSNVKGISYDVKTANILDKIYSPYSAYPLKRNKFKNFTRNIFCKFHGGVHLIFIIKKSDFLS